MSRRPDRTARIARKARSRRLSLELLESRELLSTFTVSSTADNGDNSNPSPGSLRAEIMAANSDNSVGADTILFALPGTGIQTIALESSLPAITRTVLIDGTTQTGYPTNNTPVVVLDGSGAGLGANGLTITTGGSSVIRGLSIVGFKVNNAGLGGEGIYIEGPAGNNLLQGNYVGVGADGSTAKANSSGILVLSANNTIGGASSLAKNVVSGNDNAGILIAGTSATGNVVAGDYLGTDATGSNAVGNQYGVLLMASSNTIGGTLAGSGNVISGNIGPTGNTGAGILMQGQATGNLVAGNKIGTNASGTSAVIPNTSPAIHYSNVYGIYFGSQVDQTSDNIIQETIGGTISGAGNLISGNYLGITGNLTPPSGTQNTGSLIAGNTVGLNLAGNGVIPNGGGILLRAFGTTIGGPTVASRNVIAASSTTTGLGATGTGLDLTGDSDVIQGNYVGLTSSGLSATGTANVIGMALNLTNSTVGGTVLGTGNIISGNSGDAITLQGTGTVGILGNLIGEDARGNSDPNAGNGINLTIALPAGSTTPTTPLAVNDSIGGTAAGAGNTIAHNGGAGIVVHDTYPTGYTGLGIRSNAIFANARLGIDTQGNGTITPSTLFLNGYSVANGRVTVTGVYSGKPSTTVMFDLFAGGADPTGYGQAPIFLGTVTATTNASGFATFGPSFASPPTPYTSFSATSTDISGNTSEFSANYPTVPNAAQANLTVQTSASSTSLVVGNTVTLTEKVFNQGPNTANNVTLYDTLPTSLVNTQVAASAGGALLDTNNVLTANFGTLAPNTFAYVTITATVSVAGTFTDQPGASSTTFDPNYVDNFAQQTITVGQGSSGPTADLGILESASPTSGLVGSPLTYTISVGNNGPNTATNATITDFLPAGVTIIGITASQGGPSSLIGTIITQNLGSLAPGAVATFTVVVSPTAAGSITNKANVSGNQYDPAPSNNSTTLTTTVAARIPSIHFMLAQTPYPAVGAVGQLQAFTMTVENFGPDAATNSVLVDNLPANVTFSSAKASQGSAYTLVNGQLRENFGTLAAGAVATLQLFVIPNAVGLITNAAGIYTPDVPSAAPSYANASVAIASGPAVSALNGSGGNSVLVISFDEALNPTTATNMANFQLVAMGKTGKGPAKTIKIASLTYNSTAHTVTLVPSQAIDPTQYYQITVIGSTSTGVADTLGRRLVNPQYTTPGANFSALFFAGTLPQI